MKAILHFLGQERPLLNVKVQYYTYFEQWNGRPSSIPMGGLLWMQLESAALDTVLEERISTMNYDLYPRGYPTDKGKIIFYDENGDVLKRWKFNDAIIKTIKTRLEITGESSMITTLEISAAIQEFGHLHVKWWKTSDVQEDTYKSPVVSEENKEPKILNGWWTKEKENSQNLKKAKLGDTVYFHIETKNIKDGEEIDCKLYDLDKFIWDYLNPDDDKFNKKEVHKKVTVKNNKATIELLLNQGWEKNLKDDTAYDIELYWKVKYKDISKNLPKKQNSYLEVEFSDQTLYFNFPDPNYNFPEMFANDGSPLVIVNFVKDKITGEIKGELQGRLKNQAIKSVGKLNTSIGTKMQNIAVAKLEKGFLVDSRGKIHTKKRRLYDRDVFLDGKVKRIKMGKNFTNKHITTTKIDQLQYFTKNGKKVQFLNTLKISKNMVGLAFDNYQKALDLNSLMSNGLDHSKPLSIPILKANIAIPFELLSQIAFQIHKDGQGFIKEVIKQELEEAKLKGIEAVEDFVAIHENIEGYGLIEINTETLNKLLNEEFKTIKELEMFNNSSVGGKEIKLLFKETINPNRDEYICFIETIFLNY